MRAGWWRRWLSRKPRPRDDYRTFEMDRMKSWGHNAFWWPSEYVGEKACIFGRKPHEGDVLTEGDTAYVITTSRTPSNPGDQHFVAVERWGLAADLPPSQRKASWTDGLV